MTSALDLDALADALLAELRPGLAGQVLAQTAPLAEAIASAKRVACYGVGREGLMMRALAMRLYHLGCSAHVVGDMTTPPVGEGDLLLVSAGPGSFATVAALVEVAKEAKASTACITAEKDGAVPRAVDLVACIPAQTMAADQGEQKSSILPMGSLYEALMFLFFEVLVLKLAERLKQSPAAMRANHTNLE